MARVSYPGVYVDEFAPAAVIQGVMTVAGGFLIGAAAAIAAAKLRQRCRRS